MDLSSQCFSIIFKFNQYDGKFLVGGINNKLVFPFIFKLAIFGHKLKIGILHYPKERIIRI